MFKDVWTELLHFSFPEKKKGTGQGIMLLPIHNSLLHSDLSLHVCG